MKYPIKNRSIDLELVRELNKELNLPFFAGAVLSARGINSVSSAIDFFSSELNLSDPLKMASMKEAVDSVLKNIRFNKKIIIYGDFDTDGITSTSILKRFFKKLDYQNIEYFIPKEKDGHGLSVGTVKNLAEAGAGLIITVDNGTNAEKEISFAKSVGVDVIVTDHHLPDSNFAYSAAAVLNPNRKDCSSEFKSYSGGGMALLFCIGIAKALKMESDYITKDLFVLATISTIADMVPLVGDNRKIIKFGLNNLKSSGITGLSMLMDKVYMSGPEEVSARDVSFRIAPLINAAGKFGFAESAITVLTSEDRFSINNAIKNLLSISSKRRELVSAAISALSAQVKEQKGNKKNFIFLVGDHRSAINGLIATRVMEEVGVPTFVASTEEENILKISGRSFGSVDLSRVISDTKDQHLGGGGHAFAAGVKIQKEKQLEFLSAVEESVSAQIESFKEFKKYWEIDGQIGCTQINSSIINALKLVSPFGKGNEPPLFILKNAEIKKDILGTKLNHYLICPYGKLKVNFATVDMSADETLGGSDILVELNFSASDPFLLVKDIKKHQ